MGSNKKPNKSEAFHFRMVRYVCQMEYNYVWNIDTQIGVMG